MSPSKSIILLYNYQCTDISRTNRLNAKVVNHRHRKSVVVTNALVIQSKNCLNQYMRNTHQPINWECMTASAVFFILYNRGKKQPLNKPSSASADVCVSAAIAMSSADWHRKSFESFALHCHETTENIDLYISE